MSRPVRRLQTRLMLAFAVFTLLVAGVFALYAVAFMYAVEDAFFDRVLEQEAQTQLAHWHASGEWIQPREPFVRIYASPDAFPEDLREARVEEPWRREFAGREGRHYHVHALQPSAQVAPTWLVAEVSDWLIVRPMRDPLFALLAATGLGLVALAIGLGFWLARRTARPLSRLAALVDAMRPDRPPPPFARYAGDDEVGVLARGLATLGERVHAFIAREREFTRDASHELRTPLAVIRSASERMQGETGLSPGGRQHLAHVHESARQLEQTVTMLLSLAREAWTEHGGESTAVLPLVERVVVEQSPLLDGKPVEVDVEVPPHLVLPVSAAVLHVLLSNLVGNAFAHTEDGRVRIDLADGRLRIANSGRIAAAEGDWTQGEPLRKREGSSGFGLGLAIVHRVCERHGIDLQLVSRADGAEASIGLDARGTEGAAVAGEAIR
ncbi:sensor histidine kinase [Marilutibacter alkalisoli]|uniref:histidine kinase n=1 Tax=Marilutibacter alkalisoli TaxID=2591633 RepID=A0A514BQ66_9GAMM|nr:HAMP domain-containing sensor histidine kinase [Lysobacter alkalisoli]QDH69533.1 HAMP domain-containing histidine kinase [Lysobacter alkalisoli]